MTGLVFHGGEVKALGEGRVGGYLVRFTDAKSPDLTGDYFTAETEFDLIDNPAMRPVYYNHAFDPQLKDRRIGIGKIERKQDDEVGLWIEAQLEMRDEYEKAIYAMAEEGKLGWSSGAPYHLVSRKEMPNNTFCITKWCLSEASLTPTPAEPRNGAMTLKNFVMGLKSDAARVCETERDFEQFLRDSGFSKKDAITLTSHGWKGLSRRDSDTEPSENSASIVAYVRSLEAMLSTGEL